MNEFLHPTGFSAAESVEALRILGCFQQLLAQVAAGWRAREDEEIAAAERQHIPLQGLAP